MLDIRIENVVHCKHFFIFYRLTKQSELKGTLPYSFMTDFLNYFKNYKQEFFLFDKKISFKNSTTLRSSYKNAEF